jgi:predicted unusual protein kinase regulating ubiquinone biosynthesis (AarF/ABC1/UbiB family)
MDENTLIGRLKRYGQVSTTLGGLATRLLSEKYLGVSVNREKYAEQLKNALGEIRGPILKVAQLLSTIPHALPEEYMRELQKLQSNAPSMGWPFVKRRMQRELGLTWEKKFKNFEREASAAASLGQVHRAESLEGVFLACKLQYPDMMTAVEADITQLKGLFNLYELYDKTISTAEVFIEIADRLKEELNYLLEAKHLKYYGHMLEREQHIHVPKVIDELTTNRLLTMTWLEGKPIMNILDKPLEFRNQVAINLFRAWYVPFYFYGTIHGDPHLGNYTVCDNSDLNLLDFGCIRIFEPRFVKAVIDLYQALKNNDKDLACSAYEAWGFKNLSHEMIETLTLWAQFLYGPLLQNRARLIDERTKPQEIYGHEIAMQVHKKLKELGGVSPPREFVFMDRAALGLGSVFMHLKSEVNWHMLFEELIADFNVEALEKRQCEALHLFFEEPVEKCHTS